MIKKNKIKLSLIDDYIKIVVIKNFFNNPFFNDINNISCVDKIKSTQQLDINLELIYNNLFEKLNLNNLSLSILKEELKENNSLFLNLQKNNFSNLDKTISQMLEDLMKISSNLKLKANSLKLTF